MAGRQLAKLARRLQAAGWPADTPACVVSRAGWPDQLVSEHRLADAGAGHRAACRPPDRRDGGRGSPLAVAPSKTLIDQGKPVRGRSARTP
jgi:uroporphyrin-III C-methyltransferase